METKLIDVIPVLPSSNINRDTHWYKEKAGFKLVSKNDIYAIVKRGKLCIHLQWHADTKDDPLLGGSVIRIFVENINPLFEEFVERGTVEKDKLRVNTPWGINEFGFYDLNNNALFIVEDV